jgi:hypothetical protein
VKVSAQLLVMLMVNLLEQHLVAEMEALLAQQLDSCNHMRLLHSDMFAFFLNEHTLAHMT